jgi:hypothetical protein
MNTTTPNPDHATITLHARHGAPLEDDQTRRTVEAAARAIAERHGVTLIRLDAQPDRITATLALSRLAAIGFAAELRRITTAWYHEHTGIDHLWGDPASDHGEHDWSPDPLQ